MIGELQGVRSCQTLPLVQWALSLLSHDLRCSQAHQGCYESMSMRERLQSRHLIQFIFDVSGVDRGHRLGTYRHPSPLVPLHGAAQVEGRRQRTAQASPSPIS